MDAKLAECKARMIEGLTAKAEAFEEIVASGEHFNTLPQAEPAVDFEEARVLAHAARSALKCVQADEAIPERLSALLWPKKTN